MSFKPSPLQTLVLFRLLFSGEEPKQSDVKELKPKPRGELIHAGLIELEKRGRAQHIVLTEKAWAWVADNLDAEFSRSPNATPALRGLLLKLKNYLEKNHIPLVEVLYPPPDREPATPDLKSRITKAYFHLSGGQRNVRVHLKDLRRELGDVTRKDLDAALLRMQNDRRLVLMHLDDPQERTVEDEEAAIDIFGHKRHIVYLEG